ncbi:hypothetical protein SLA2020_527360 [Shorea laevis]
MTEMSSSYAFIVQSKLLTKVERIILNLRSCWSEGQAKHSPSIGHERRMSIGTPSISRNAALARNISDSGIIFFILLFSTSHVLFIGAHTRIRCSGEVLYASNTASRTTTPVLDRDLSAPVTLSEPPRR